MMKNYLLAVIVLTQFSALFIDQKVPYFPIEISRTAASRPVAYTIFISGIAFIPPY